LRDEGNTDYDKMTKELGDVMWYVARLAHRYNLKLDDIASENITKLQDRKQRGVICGVGDNR
jgi:NTP pyrophosphatase (non-canonical NTP hydrolase)